MIIDSVTLKYWPTPSKNKRQNQIVKRVAQIHNGHESKENVYDKHLPHQYHFFDIKA